MISVASALEQILEKMAPLPAQSCPLLDALGCVLAEEKVAREALPPFTNSAMDGYAIRQHNSELIPHLSKIIGRDSPLFGDRTQDSESVYAVVETVAAGDWSERTLKAGQAVRIMTGAPLPEGADTVIPVEETTTLPNGFVRIHGKMRRGQHIRPAGEEMQPGERLFSPGRILQPADLGLLASQGVTHVKVIPRPRVSVITTGSEVVDPKLKPQPGQIRNSNLTAIAASVLASGGQLGTTGHVADDPVLLESVLTQPGSDVLITCGGVSVGDYDFVKTVLVKRGEIYFWKVAIKPGKPFVFGRIKTMPSSRQSVSRDPQMSCSMDPGLQSLPAGRQAPGVTSCWVFGLPGNPVSALVAFDVLVRPALRALAGHTPNTHRFETATLSRAIHHKPGRREFVRAQIHPDTQGWVAEPLRWQGSGMLRSLTEANAWLVVPEESENLAVGSQVQVLMKEAKS